MYEFRSSLSSPSWHGDLPAGSVWAAAREGESWDDTCKDQAEEGDEVRTVRIWGLDNGVCALEVYFMYIRNSNS
jgi:hypothetical protein